MKLRRWHSETLHNSTTSRPRTPFFEVEVNAWRRCPTSKYAIAMWTRRRCLGRSRASGPRGPTSRSCTLQPGVRQKAARPRFPRFEPLPRVTVSVDTPIRPARPGLGFGGRSRPEWRRHTLLASNEGCTDLPGDRQSACGSIAARPHEVRWGRFEINVCLTSISHRIGARHATRSLARWQKPDPSPCLCSPECKHKKHGCS